MATYYTIQTWRNRAYEWETFNLYETFDEACDTIEGYMKAYEDFDESEFEKIKPNREEKRKNIESWNRIAYLTIPNGEEKHIVRMKVVPKKQKPKKYVYQYFVRNNEQTTSPKYETFDEVCDVLDKELRKLHGEDWRPRMTREERKNIMEFFALSPIYFYYKTDMYILFRTEV